MESKVCSLSHGLALWPGPTSPPAPQKTAFYRPRDTARNSGAPQAAADRRAGGNREMDPPRASAALVNHGLPAKPSAALSYAQGSQKRKEYHVLRNLGAGTKASVKLAKHARTGQLVALKSIRKPVIPDVARRASPKTFQGMAPASGSGPGGQSSAAAGSPSPHNSRDSAAGSSRDVSGAGTNLNGTNGSAGTDAVVSPEREEYALAEKEWRTEVSIMARVGHHENLPTLIDAFETSSKWYIAMTYCQGGDLLSRLLQIEHYSERHAASIMATICNAVHYLHSHGIAHRDLKPANLLMKDETENSNLCIIDFNAGFIVEDPSLMLAHPNSFQSPTPNNFVAKQSMKTVTGTPFYLAPEIVLGQQYTTMVDTWSLGCIAFQLLTGVTPFQSSTSYEQLYAKILNADYTFPDDIPLSNLAKDFVRSLLVPNPNARASAAQALAHPWIQTLVPPGYLMLLQQFNHEADPVMFAPPHRIWGEMPPPTALPPPLPPLAGRTESAEMRLQELAGLTTTPSAPTGWVMPQTGYKLDPLDQEFGMTLKSRWEVMGRPGILQIPTTDEFFEHEDLFGYQPPPNAGSLGRRKSTTLHAGAAGDGMSVMGMPGMPGIPGMPGTSLAPMTGLEPGQGHQMAPMELRMVAPQHFQAGDGGYPAAPTDSEMQTEGDDMPSLVVTLKRGLSQRFSLDRPKSGNETAENPDVERAESGIQVSWSPSGGLYLPETEKHKLKLFSTEGSDDEHHAMMDLTAVNPQRISTMEQVSKFPMLDLLRSQTGVSSPLWEWETASDMFGVGHHGHGAQHAAHPGKVPLPSRYSVIHTT